MTILIPVFGSVDKLQLCLESLTAHAPPWCTVHVLDDATPDDSIGCVCAHFPVHYARQTHNQGFVRTCNWGFSKFWDAESDLLLLNSDAELTTGAIEEMQSVLLLNERHGTVTPRSNRGTIYSVPFVGEPMPAADSYLTWQNLHGLLPRYSVMPTAVGFCMLIRRELLPRFGLFDDIYSPGYNEENDFVCRINRRGYSAVAANRAYVFHHEMSSFGEQRSILEQRNQEILHARYPEYPAQYDRYVRFGSDPLEHYASLFLPHRPRILFDLFHLSPHHNGTSLFGLNLLREFSRIAEDYFDVYLGISDVCLDYFAPEVAGYRTYTGPVKEEFLFDLVFKPSQMYRWDEFNRAIRCGPILCLTVQDAIAIRCDYLSTTVSRDVFAKSALLADHVFTISHASAGDFNALCNTSLPLEVIQHGSSWAAMPPAPASCDYVLIVGNAYAHKGVEDAVAALPDDIAVIVLGVGETDHIRPNLQWHASGQLTHREINDLFFNAGVIVYPSHYEGFGLPIIDAAVLGKPIIVMNTEVNREVARLAGDRYVRRLESLNELTGAVNELWDEPLRPREVRSWSDVAQEYLRSIRKLFAAGINPDKLRARWEWIRTVESIQ